MSYKCQVCEAHVAGSMRRYSIRRPDNSIAREIPVCDFCQRELAGGVPFVTLREQQLARFRPRPIEVTPDVIAAEPIVETKVVVNPVPPVRPKVLMGVPVETIPIERPFEQVKKPTSTRARKRAKVAK